MDFFNWRTDKMRCLTEAAFSSIEFESRWTVEWQPGGRYPLASVSGQLTVLHASVVEKPTTCQVVGFRAQLATHRPRRVAHFDCLEIFRNHSNVSIQLVLVATLCHIIVVNITVFVLIITAKIKSCLIRVIPLMKHISLITLTMVV